METHNSEISKRNDLILIRYKSGVHRMDILKEFHITQKKYREIIQGFGLKTKRNFIRPTSLHKLDIHIFDSVDSSDKAYWLGYLMADGGIINPRRFSLISKDLEVLEKFKMFLSTTIPIIHNKNFDDRTQKTYESYQMLINSSYMVEKLNEYHINKEKSYNAKFPDIDEKYYPDYIRGVFDGDGSIFKKLKSNFGVSIIGTEEITKFMKEYFIKTFNFSDVKFGKVCDNKKAKQFKLYIHRHEDLINFYNFIYNDKNSCRLTRKFIKFNELIEIYKNRPVYISKPRGKSYKKRELPYAIYKNGKKLSVGVSIGKSKIKWIGTFQTIELAKEARNKYLSEHGIPITD
jgi:hypothetical protein